MNIGEFVLCFNFIIYVKLKNLWALYKISGPRLLDRKGMW